MLRVNLVLSTVNCHCNKVLKLTFKTFALCQSIDKGLILELLGITVVWCAPDMAEVKI